MARLLLVTLPGKAVAVIRRFACSMCLALGALVGGCAAPASIDNVVAAPQAARECVAVTGTGICRKPGSGNSSHVDTISGDDLRRSGGPITGAQPGVLKD
jgi:hypothetical protein